MTELGRVGHRQQAFAFQRIECVLGRLQTHGALIAWPARQGALTEADRRTGTILPRTRADGFANESHDFAALREGGHLTSPSQSARNFFCRISKAAASDRALSLRKSSRLSGSFSSFSPRSSRPPGTAFASVQNAVFQPLR